MPVKLDPELPIPLYLQLRDMLRQQILSGDCAGFLPKEEELCRQYEVSRRTVSRAMAMLAETGLVRRIKSKGTLVRRGEEAVSHGHIGLVFPVTTGWKDPLQPMQQAAAQLGRSLVVFPYDWFNPVDQQKSIMIAKNSCDGIIVYPNAYETDRQTIQEIYKSGYPLIMFDIYYEECDCSYVGMDYLLCARRLTEALIKSPGDRIGLIQITNKHIHCSDRERTAGFHQALERMKVKFDPSLELQLPSFDWHSNVKAITAFLLKNRLDGVFVTDQNCYQWENIGQLEIPPLRISTLGMRPNFSRLPNFNFAEQPEDEIGRLAVQLLHEKLNTPGTPSKRVMVSPRYHWQM